MKELFLIRENLSNKISYYHLLLLLASLPFDRFYSHIILISFAIHTLIQLKAQQFRSIWRVQTIVLASVFFITVLSTVYTINPAGAYGEWGKQITILLIPLLFCCTSLDIKKYRTSLLLAFSLVCTATIGYLYIDAFFTIRYYGLPLSSIFSAYFTNHNFSAPIDMHATFLSMQLAIALVYLLSVLIHERSNYRRIFYLGCMGVLSAGLIQLSSKSVCFCLVLIITLALPYFLLPLSKRKKFILITASVFILPIILILNIHTFRARFISQLRNDLSEVSTTEVGDPRLARWGATAELIAKRPVTGYGAGSEIGVLQQIFFEKKYYSSYLYKLNAHNQYLSFLLKSGPIGLLVYLATLGFGLRLALVRKDLFLFLFIALIVFVSVAENLLDVDKGIIFYAFFFSFFVFSSAPGKEIAGG